MVKQVNHGKDDPGQTTALIKSIKFFLKTYCAQHCTRICGEYRRNHRHRSELIPPNSLQAPPHRHLLLCLQNANLTVPLTSTATTAVTRVQARQTRPHSMPGLTSSRLVAHGSPSHTLGLGHTLPRTARGLRPLAPSNPCL